jgi:uncharacterized alpha/beta hydrolase family protein
VVGKYDYTKTPVSFVHGYGMTAGSWDKMIPRLIKDGYSHNTSERYNFTQIQIQILMQQKNK